MGSAARAVPGQPDDRARHDHRERRAALDPAGPRFLRVLAGLGGQRLPAHLRRLPAARRPARRPVRPPAAVPDRHRRCSPLASVACGLAASAERAGRCARRAGPRRRGGLGRRAVPGDEPVHRARRARQGDGRHRLRRRRRRQHRRPARRGAHQLAGLALDLPGQRADRRRRDPALAARPAGGARPRRGLAARRRRRGDRDHRADARGLRDRQRQRGRLDIARRRSGCSAAAAVLLAVFLRHRSRGRTRRSCR